MPFEGRIEIQDINMHLSSEHFSLKLFAVFLKMEHLLLRGKYFKANFSLSTKMFKAHFMLSEFILHNVFYNNSKVIFRANKWSAVRAACKVVA